MRIVNSFSRGQHWTPDAGQSSTPVNKAASRMTSGGNLWCLKETGCMRIPQSGGQFCAETEKA